MKTIINEVLSRQEREIVDFMKQEMLDNIYYIGNELPQVAQDRRDKFVLLGTPQKFIDAITRKFIQGKVVSNKP
jgi:hypothetical protein